MGGFGIPEIPIWPGSGPGARLGLGGSTGPGPMPPGESESGVSGSVRRSNPAAPAGLVLVPSESFDGSIILRAPWLPRAFTVTRLRVKGS